MPYTSVIKKKLTQFLALLAHQMNDSSLAHGDHLQTVNMTIKDGQLCVLIYHHGSTTHMFCVQPHESDDLAGMHVPCTGYNSSEGLMVFKKRVLVGLSTWGTDCGTHFTTVAPLVPWIARYAPNAKWT